MSDCSAILSLSHDVARAQNGKILTRDTVAAVVAEGWSAVEQAVDALNPIALEGLRSCYLSALGRLPPAEAEGTFLKQLVFAVFVADLRSEHVYTLTNLPAVDRSLWAFVERNYGIDRAWAERSASAVMELKR